MHCRSPWGFLPVHVPQLVLLTHQQNHLSLQWPFAHSHRALQPGHSSKSSLTTRDGGKRAERPCTAPKSHKSKKQHQQCTEVQTCPTWVSAQPRTLPAPTRHQAVISELVDDIVFLFTACLFFHPQRYYFFHSWRDRLGKGMCPLLLAAWFGCCFLLLMFLIREEMAVHLWESHSVIS